MTAETASTAGPKVSKAKAFDVSKPLRELAKEARTVKAPKAHPNARVDRNVTFDRGGTAESLTAGGAGTSGAVGTLAVGADPRQLRGPVNQDNFDVFGFRVNPPDTIGDVGPNHFVEMINLVFAVYDKTGTCSSGRSIPAPMGGICRRRTARIPPAIRSSSTTSSRTAGS